MILVNLLLDKGHYISVLLKNYYVEKQKESLPLIGKDSLSEKNNYEIFIIPKWVFGTEIYQPSRIMKAIQYVWEQNVIRIWNDDVLNEDKKNRNNSLLLGKSD